MIGDKADDPFPAAASPERTPFGTPHPALGQTGALTTGDAVRRCRWIAIDSQADDFGLFFVGTSIERSRLVGCFDSEHPRQSLATKYLTGAGGEDLANQIRISSEPCWWSADPRSPATRALRALTWARQRPAPVPMSTGIAFPVYADRDCSGVVVFLGPRLALDEHSLPAIHARCFDLFAAVTHMRTGEFGEKLPSVSKRELQCLRLTANGHTSNETAKLLKLSVHTANDYLTNLQNKLFAVNRAHTVAKALRLGIID